MSYDVCSSDLDLVCEILGIDGENTVDVHVTSPTLEDSCEVYDFGGSFSVPVPFELPREQIEPASVTSLCGVEIGMSVAESPIPFGGHPEFIISLSNDNEATVSDVALKGNLPFSDGSWSFSPAVGGCTTDPDTEEFSRSGLDVGTDGLELHLTANGPFDK